jgi:polysaccharide chain length determinant protein (PEP-CTERM system associated)
MSDSDFAEFDERPGRSVLEYLEVPFRYRRYFWIPFVTFVVLGLLAAVVAPRKYRSGTLILVESKNLPDTFVTPMTSAGMAERLNTIRQVVLSRTRLEQVLQKLDPYPEMKGESTFAMVEAMRRAIEIRVQGSDSFVIEYVNRSPAMAMNVTNMLALQFTDDAARLRDALTQKAFGFLETNLDDARKAVEERETALSRHKLKYWGALPEQLDTNLRMLGQLQVEQGTLAENLRILEDRRSLLERSLLEGRRLAATAAGTAGAATELLKLRATYNSLRGRYTDDHPDMQALKARMEKVQQQVAESQKDGGAEREQQLSDPESVAMSQSLKLVEADLDSLHKRRDTLDERIRQLQLDVEKTPRAEQELSALTRDYQQLRENYNAALKKEMDAQMARRLEEYWKGGYFRVLDPAHLPGTPIRPLGTLFILGGLALGLVAGLAGTFVGDLLDRSVKSERELAELVNAPILATFPRVEPTTGGTA